MHTELKRPAHHEGKQYKKSGRINLNDPETTSTDENAVHQYSDQNLNDLDRNLAEQFGGTDNSISDKPNNI